jgi:hypothetical protein
VTQHRISVESPFLLAEILTGESSKRVPIHGLFTSERREAAQVKMKIFTGYGDTVVLEAELNEWLENNPYITIKDIRQSYVASREQLCTLMSVWYVN